MGSPAGKLKGLRPFFHLTQAETQQEISTTTIHLSNNAFLFSKSVQSENFTVIRSNTAEIAKLKDT